MITAAFAQITLSNTSTQKPSHPSPSQTRSDGLSVTAISVGDTIPSGIAVNPNTNKVYVTRYDPILSIINGDTNKVIKNVNMGKALYGVAVNPITNTIYVNDESNTTSVINGYNNSIVKTINLGKTLNTIATNPVTNKVYVGYRDKQEISVIDGNTNNVVKNIVLDAKPSTTVNSGINDIAVNPITNLIYTSSGSSNYNTNYKTISVVDGNTGRIVKDITRRDLGDSIDVDPITNRIYVTQYRSILVIDGNTNNIIQNITYNAPPFNDSYAIAINPTSKILYVSDLDDNDLGAINTTSNTVFGNVTLEDLSGAMTVNPITNTVYTFSDGLAAGVNNYVYAIKENNQVAKSPLSSPRQDYITWYDKGVDLLNKKTYTDALAAFNKAILIDPNQAAAWQNRGAVLDTLKRYQESLDSFNKAISMDPSKAIRWDSKGTALYHLGRYQEALDSYNKAISIDPSNPAYHKNKDIVLKRMGAVNTIG